MITSAAMPPKALVAGATGYTGQQVVAHLRERGVDTIAHVRPDSSKLVDWTNRFEALGAVVDTTAWESETIAAMLADRAPTVVFALLGTTRARAKREAAQGVPPEANSYERVDYGLTVMLLDGLAAAGLRSTRFVYLSSEGVKETKNPYLAVRHRIETRLRAGEQPFTIARPSFITGPDRDESRPGESIGAALSDAALGLLGALGGRATRERYRSITARELAGALVHFGLSNEGATRTLRGDELRGFG